MTEHDKVTQKNASPDLYEQSLKEKTLFWVEAVLDEFKESFLIQLELTMVSPEVYWKGTDSIDYRRVMAEFRDHVARKE